MEIDEIDLDEILETILDDIRHIQGKLKVTKHYMQLAKKKGDIELGFLYFKEIKVLETKIKELWEQYKIYLNAYIKEEIP